MTVYDSRPPGGVRLTLRLRLALLSGGMVVVIAGVFLVATWLAAGDWQILMLNSNIPATRGSPQWEFARAELERQRTPCTMAVWHHPLFSSGPNGPNTFMRDMWALLEANRVEVILNANTRERYQRYRHVAGR